MMVMLLKQGQTGGRAFRVEKFGLDRRKDDIFRRFLLRQYYSILTVFDIKDFAAHCEMTAHHHDRGQVVNDLSTTTWTTCP